jgi:hypothetical protein
MPEFPEAYAAFVLGKDADDHTRARGSRGFATTGRDYHYIDDQEELGNGDKLILATLETVWGNDFDESEFNKLYIFRIRADQADAFRKGMWKIDETIHALEGVHQESVDDYRKARKLGPWSR